MPSGLRHGGRLLTALAVFSVLGPAHGAAAQLISVSEEIQLGRDAQVELRRVMPEVHDAVVRDYVARVGARLVRFAGGAAYPYSFSTADAREVNAFALPGGPVWINRGLLEMADDEAQVAGVLAHEIAHVAGRHTARQLRRAIWTNGALAVLGSVAERSGWRGAAISLGAAAATGGAMMSYSRRDERDADREGVRMLREAGYDPRALLEFMRRLDADHQRPSGALARFFSSHPAPRERVRHLQRLTIAGTGARTGPDFADLQRRLSLMAVPPRRPSP